MDTDAKLIEVIQLSTGDHHLLSQSLSGQSMDMTFHNVNLLDSINSCDISESVQISSNDQPHLQLVSSLLQESEDKEIGHGHAVTSVAVPGAPTQLVTLEESQNQPQVLTRSKSAMEQSGLKMRCCSCNSILNGERSECSLNESVTCQVFNVSSKELNIEAVRIVDVLSKIFRIDIGAFALKTGNPFVMCLTCINTLSKLYELYNEFISIFVLNDTILCKLVNVVRLLENEVKVSNSGGKIKKENSFNKSVVKRKVTEIVLNEKGQAVLKCEEGSFKSSGSQKSRNIKRKKRFIRCKKSLRAKNRSKISSQDRTSLSENTIIQAKSINLIDQNQLQEIEKSDFLKDSQNEFSQDSTSSLENIQCDRCDKRFKTFGGLKIHYAAHLRDDNKVTCRECGKKFKKPEALEMHERIDHKGFKPHKCSHEGCDRSFRLKDKLKLHIKVVHEKNLPFPCPKCDKAFRTKYHLKVHDVAQHVQGDDAVGCSKCRRKFPTKEALETHIKTHEEEKRFVCTQCNKGFQSASRLKLHVKSHDSLPSAVCATCGKAYKHVRDLRLHEVTHQDESSFRFGCSDCPRRFYRIDLLRVHQSNEKHFTQEVVGPSISKLTGSQTNKVKRKQNRQLGIATDDKESESTLESKNEERDASPAKGKRKQAQKPKTEPIPKMKSRDSIYDCLGSSTLFPSMIPVDVMNDSSNNLEIVEISPSLINTTIANSLYRKEVQDIQDQSSSYILNSKDPIIPNVVNTGSNSLTIPDIQSTHFSLPATMTGNTIFTVKDSSDRNISSFSIAAGAEQIGYDVINAFINNLN